MPADKDFAMLQLKRFTSFPGVPQTVSELEERADYLAEVSPTNAQCKEIADRLIHTLRYFPLPVDMDIAAEKNAPRDWEPDPKFSHMDRITGDGRFYDELEPELIDKTFQMLDSKRAEVRKFAEQVLNGLVAHGRISRESIANRGAMQIGAAR